MKYKMAQPTPAGDELRLRHPCPRAGSLPWLGLGLVVRLDDASEEVAVELRKEKGGYCCRALLSGAGWAWW